MMGWLSFDVVVSNGCGGDINAGDGDMDVDDRNRGVTGSGSSD